MDINKIITEVTTVIKGFCGDKSANYGCILGSGLGNIANLLTDKSTLSYQEIPYLNPGNIEGHAGQLCFGKFGNTNIVCMQGRPHWYEGVEATSFIALIAAIQACGANSIIITNATGGINPNYAIGDIVMITDHINMQYKNPLIGISPPPFISMDQVYDLELQNQLQTIAQQADINLQTGVYCGVLGPCFETPAEINAYRTQGADVIAMSMIPEVITAKFLGCKVLGLSVIANLAAGLNAEPLSHAVTLAGVKQGAESLNKLLVKFFTQ